MKRTGFALFLSLTVLSALRAETITQWDFNSGAGGTNTPIIGTGTITHLGGVTHPGFNSGSGSSDPVQPGQAHQTTTYPAQSSASGTAGIQFSVNTTGFENVVCTFDMRTSNTCSRWHQIRYTTDGVNFVDIGSPIRLERFNTEEPPQEIGVGDFWSNLRTVDFTGVSGVSNNPNFAFQVVSIFSPVAFTEFVSSTNYAANTAYESARNRQFGGTASAYAATGTWRFDMVTFAGDAITGGDANIVDQFVNYSNWGGPGSAIDDEKQVYRQSKTSTTLAFTNLINASQGITGVGFEIENLGNAVALSPSDFRIQVSPNGAFDEDLNPPSGWADGPAPSVTVTSGKSSDQVLLSWSTANSAKNQWLRITIKANSNTGLVADEFFFVGHLLGETTGLSGSVFTVAFADISPIRAAAGNTVNASSISDIDKTGTVSFADISAMRGNVGAQLSNITVP